MSKVKTFFKTIFKYLAENVWLQPVLLVALIFAIIFSLSGIPNVVDTVKGWFNNDSEKTTLKVEKLTNEQIEAKYLDGEEFIFVIGKEDCLYCEEYIAVLNKYYNKAKASSTYNNGIKLYYLDVSKDDDGEYKDETILETTYSDWYERIYEGTKDTKWNGKTGFSTPTTVFVSNQKVVYAEEGVMTLSKIETKSALIKD
jgi:thioredoxin-related protein